MPTVEQTPFSYSYGLVQNRNVFRGVAQIDKLSVQGTPNASLIKSDVASGQRSAFHLPWQCTRLAIQKVPRGAGIELVYMGPDGRVGYGGANGDSESMIWPASGGPGTHGLLRDLKSIGDGVYAVGMGRQVYRRNIGGAWERRDAGLLQAGGVMDVAGFNAIHGVDESDLYAVGFAGEVWHCREGAWNQLRSPTDVILNAVHVLPDRRAVVAGMNGFLMMGSAEGWEIIDTGLNGQIWDVHHFNGATYLTTNECLYRLDAGRAPQPVEMNLGRLLTFGQLHSADGVLLSTGRKHQCWTADGVVWHCIA